MLDEEHTFLGVDLSTQQLKGIVIDENLRVLHEESVEYDSLLPEFRTHKGVLQSEDGSTVLSPTIMWVKAMDLLLDKLQVAGADFGKLAAISGCAQSHGTVYWQKNSEAILQSLDPSSFLHTQLASCFTITNSPIWMDSSTTQYCRKLEEAVGGSKELARITGSIAYERFSASQIAKIADTKRIAYDNTERISLVSSFACSLFLGKYAPIDFSDGSGMNLLDINEKQWSEACLKASAPNLAGKLGTPVPSDTDLGVVSPYFVERFAFNPECRVVAFTGDNSASLIGMRMNYGDVSLSLGTSDTIFLLLKEAVLLPEGHVFINPLDPDTYMMLLCFKNGSLMREFIRDKYANQSWDEFCDMLEKTPRGNFGNMGFYFDVPEIIPPCRGEFRFDKEDNDVKKFSSAAMEVRALIEGQFIAKRAHVEDLGFQIDNSRKVLVTGGASKNKSIIQVISDVFNSPIYEEGSRMAVLGAAYLAKQAIRDRIKNPDAFKYLNEITASLPPANLVCTPYGDSEKIYSPMIERYRQFLKRLSKNSTDCQP